MSANQRGFHSLLIGGTSDTPPAVAPRLVQLLPAGQFSGRDGRGPYQVDAAAILRSFAEWGMPLAVDYEHQGLHAPSNGAPAPAAGWVKRLVANSNGIFGEVDWTATAKAMIESGEYRYLSPVFDHAQGGTVFRIIGAGLTNTPNLFLTAINRAQQGVNPLVRDAMTRGITKEEPVPSDCNPLVRDAMRRVRESGFQ